MAKALEVAYAHLDQEQAEITQLKTYFIQRLKALFPDLQFNGFSEDLAQSTYTLINVQLPVPKDKIALLDFHLDLKGVACSKGSACQSGSSSGSHVIRAYTREKKVLIRLCVFLFHMSTPQKRWTM